MVFHRRVELRFESEDGEGRRGTDREMGCLVLDFVLMSEERKLGAVRGFEGRREGRRAGGKGFVSLCYSSGKGGSRSEGRVGRKES